MRFLELLLWLLAPTELVGVEQVPLARFAAECLMRSDAKDERLFPPQATTAWVADVSPLLVRAVEEFGHNNEILDPESCINYFDGPVFVIGYLRHYRQIYAKYPKLEDIQAVLPSIETVIRANKEAAEHIADMRLLVDHWPYEPIWSAVIVNEYQVALSAKEPWEIMWRAYNPANDIRGRRSALNELRELVGSKNYYSSNFPHWIPKEHYPTRPGGCPPALKPVFGWKD